MAVLPILRKGKCIIGSETVTILIWRIPDERGQLLDYFFRRGPYCVVNHFVGKPEELTVAGLNTAAMQTEAKDIFDRPIVDRDRFGQRIGNRMNRLLPRGGQSIEMMTAGQMESGAFSIFFAGMSQGKRDKYEKLFIGSPGNDLSEVLWELCKRYDRER